MQSSTSYFLRRTSQLGRYSWRNRRSVIYKPLQEFTCSALLTCLTVVYQMQKLFAPYKTWLGWTSVCTSILTLDQMILRLSSIPFDFWFSFVVSGLGGKDERTSLDYLSTRLEMMVKELDFALIVVSHVNDDGLTRGSRNISKIADIRVDLYRDVTSADPVVRRTTRLVVSKNW